MWSGTAYAAAVFRAGAFATITNEQGEILLCHRRDLDLWNLPGGSVEAGESPWEAVVREIREETGVDADVVRLASVSWKPRRFPVEQLPERLSPAVRHRILSWSRSREETILIVDDGPSGREFLEQLPVD